MNMVVNGEIRNVKPRRVGQQQSLVKVGVFASEQIRPRSTKAGIEASDPLQYRGANDRISTQHRSEAIILPILADAITRINPADDCRVVAGQPFRNRTAPAWQVSTGYKVGRRVLEHSLNSHEPVRLDFLVVVKQTDQITLSRLQSR